MELLNETVRKKIRELSYDAMIEELKEKIIVKYYGVTFKMSLKRAHLNVLIIDEVFNFYGKEMLDTIGEDILYDLEGDKKSLKKYLRRVNEKVKKGLSFNLENKLHLSYMMSRVFDGISKFGIIHNVKVSTSISIDKILEACEKYPEFGEIIYNDHFTNTMDVRDIYVKKEELSKKTLKLIKDNQIEPFYTLLQSGGGMREPQLMDVLVGVGIRPKYGTIYDYAVPAKMLNGYTNRQEWFVEVSSATNALILTKVEITRPGTLLKKALGAAQLIYVNNEDCCDTKTFFNFDVLEENDLNKIKGFYRVSTNGEELVKGDEVHLIGKTIKLRTPLTCNSKKGICKKCSGIFADMFPYNITLPEFTENIGTYLGLTIVFKLLGPEGQSFLSAKHHIKAFIEMFSIISDDGRDEKTFCDLEYNVIKFKDILHVRAKGVVIENEECQIKQLELVDKEGEVFLIQCDVDQMYFFTKEPVEENEDITDRIIRVYVLNKEIGSKFTHIENLYKRPSYDAKSGENKGIYHHLNEFRKIYPDEHLLASIVLTRMVIRDAMTKELPDFSSLQNNAVAESLDTVLKHSPSLGSRLSIGHLSTVFTDPKYYIDDAPSLLDDMLKKRS